MKTREEDFVAQLIIDSTHSFLLCFTNLAAPTPSPKVYEVPDVGTVGKGKAMASLVSLQPGEKIVTILPVKNLEEDGKNILFATRNGTVKKTPLKDFSNVQSRGIIAIGIDKDDELITARITDGHQVIFLATHDGMAIRVDEQDLRPMGRPAFGNRGINLRKGDYVVGAAVTPSNEARNKQRLERAAISGKKDPGLTSSKPSSTKPRITLHPLSWPSPARSQPPPSPTKSPPSSRSSTSSSGRAPQAGPFLLQRMASASAPTSTSTAFSPAAVAKASSTSRPPLKTAKSPASTSSTRPPNSWSSANSARSSASTPRASAPPAAPRWASSCSTSTPRTRSPPPSSSPPKKLKRNPKMVRCCSRFFSRKPEQHAKAGIGSAWVQTMRKYASQK